MTFNEVLEAHMRGHVEAAATVGCPPKAFARESEPHIHYDFEAGDGPVFWAMNHETDELEEHAFTAVQIFATDWTI